MKRLRSPSLTTPTPSKQLKSVKSNAELEPPFVIDAAAGLRRVDPYWYTYKINVKGRWFKRRLIDVFSEEFKDQTREYYVCAGGVMLAFKLEIRLSKEPQKRAIETGKLSVNNEKKSCDYFIKNGDVVSHSMHRHEPPVSFDPIKIVFQNEDTLIVDKPAGIPVHATGRYHHNTVLGILKSKEYGFTNLFSVNRLDRLTSGILLLALTKEKAAQLSSQLTDRSVSKTYLCRVRGKFPDEPVVCTEPILVTSNKLGVNIASREKGLPCETHFTIQSYNTETNTSIVQVFPKTGRMHQIRVHLQYLGYPIANDPIYANPEFWGEGLGKGGLDVDMETVSQRIKAAKIRGVAISDDEVGFQGVETVSQSESSLTQIPSSIDGELLSAQEFPCPRCAVRLPDPTYDELRIYLHSWKYSGDGWAYETDVPEWASNQ